MNKMNLILCLLCIIIFAENTGCRKEPASPDGSSVGSEKKDDSSTNRQPVARAGNDTAIQLPSVSVILNGAASYDPDNNITSYSWTKVSGPASGIMQGDNQVQASVVNMYDPGVYEFALKVTDSYGLFSIDTIQVTVNKILLASYCQAERQELAVRVNLVNSIPTNVRWPLMFNTDNKLVIVAATIYDSENTINIYDKSTMQWTTTVINPNMIREGWNIIAAGTKVFFAGGGLTYNPDNSINTTSRVDIYDITTNSWSATNLSESRTFVNAVVAGNKVFFAGGMKTDRTFSNKVDICDMSTNTWSYNQIMGTPRAIIGSTVANNKVYFCGGLTEFKWNGGWQEDLGAEVSTIDVYDLATGHWSLDAMSGPKSGFGTISKNGTLYLAGGAPGGYAGYNVDVFNTSSNQKSISCLSGPNTFGSKNVTSFNNWLIFYGNNGFVGTIKGRLELYNIQTGKWTVGLMPSGVLQDGYWTSIVADANKIYMADKGKLYELNF